jgi:hypothetical protein
MVSPDLKLSMAANQAQAEEIQAKDAGFRTRNLQASYRNPRMAFFLD